MGKRGDRKRLMRSLKRTANRIPLGAEHLPKWLKSHFPHIYAQHVAYRMINEKGGKESSKYAAVKVTKYYSRAQFITEALRA